MLLRLRSPEASKRGSSSIIFPCIVSFFSMFGAPPTGFPITFCLSWSLMFSLSKPKSSSPRFHSSHPSILSALFLGFFSTTCVSDATSEPTLRTWAPRRLCQLILFSWIPPPSPCAVGSGCHTGWPSLTLLGNSHLMADHRLRSWEIPFTPRDRPSSSGCAFESPATPQAMTPRSMQSPNGVRTLASPVTADCTSLRRIRELLLCSPWYSRNTPPLLVPHSSPSP